MPEANVIHFPRKAPLALPPGRLGDLGAAIAALAPASPGDKGANVSALQAALLSWGFSVGSAGVDGIYGNDTTAAVKQLQAKLGTTASGTFDALTAQMVQADLGLPNGVLPRSTAVTALAPAATQAATAMKKPSPLLFAGLAVCGVLGIVFVAKAFSSGTAPSPAPQPPAPGVSGAEFFDDEDFEPAKPKRKKRKSTKKKSKAKAKAPVSLDFDEDETAAQDLPDDYDFELGPLDDELMEDEERMY